MDDIFSIFREAKNGKFWETPVPTLVYTYVHLLLVAYNTPLP